MLKKFRFLFILSMLIVSCNNRVDINTFIYNEIKVEDEEDIDMATDYARAPVIVWVESNPYFRDYNPTYGNDGDDNSYAYVGPTAPNPYDDIATGTITFAIAHNVDYVSFIAAQSGLEANDASQDFYYKYEDNWIYLGSTDQSGKKTYTYPLGKKIQGIRVVCHVIQVDASHNGFTQTYSMIAMGYDSSGKLQMKLADGTVIIADQADLTNQKLRYYNGTAIRAIPLMEAGETPLLIYDGSNVKSIAIME